MPPVDLPISPGWYVERWKPAWPGTSGREHLQPLGYRGGITSADRRVIGEHRRDAIGEWVEQGACRSAPIAQRLDLAEEPLDGVLAHPQSAGGDRLGAALPMEEPMDVGPRTSGLKSAHPDDESQRPANQPYTISYTPGLEPEPAGPYRGRAVRGLAFDQTRAPCGAGETGASGSSMAQAAVVRTTPAHLEPDDRNGP